MCLTTAPVWAQEPAVEEAENIETTEDATTESPPPPEPPIYSSRSERDMKLLENALAEPESALWLTGIDGSFLALHEDNIGTNLKGAVLILHAEGQHSNWPTTIERIRNTLPYHGWMTLATSLPNPAAAITPKRTLPSNVITAPAGTAEEQPQSAQENTAQEKEPPKNPEEPQAEAGEDNEIFDDNNNTLSDGSLTPENLDSQEQPPEPPQFNPEQIAHSRIEAAIKHLNNLGMYNIVLLGDGIGAARAGHFLNSLPQPQKDGKNTIKPIRAMVIINARNNSPRGDINLLGSLFDADLPTIDIYFGTHAQDSRDSIARKKYALRNGFKTYQQILLPEMSHNTMLGENRLSKRVRGFLEKNARGVEVENAVVTRKQ